jgi:protein ImuA
MSKIVPLIQPRPKPALPANPAQERRRSALSDSLRARIDALERLSATGSGQRGKIGPLVLGLPEINTHLPSSGLARDALHEIAGMGVDREQAASAAAFAGLWLARLPAAAPILWITRATTPADIDLHAHGLRRQGIDPARLIMVAVRRNEEVLWAMEEGLKAKYLSAVVGEIARLDLTASRRLQLAAEAGGVMAIALRRWRLAREADREFAQPIAAVTRWKIAALPADFTVEPGLGTRRWQAELWRCRGAKPGRWLFEVKDGTDGYAFSPGPATAYATAVPVDLAQPLGDGSLVEAAGGAEKRRAG